MIKKKGHTETTETTEKGDPDSLSRICEFENYQALRICTDLTDFCLFISTDSLDS